VTADGDPIITIPIVGQDWTAIIDTGFNGDLELPDALRVPLHARLLGYIVSNLAGGQRIVEENYRVDFPFDGQTIQADVTFVPGDELLIGTRLLRDHRLEIDFPNRIVQLTKTRGGQAGP
jgi:predicted aspartyl protease